MKINEKIRILREMNRFTQEEMANKLGMSINGYSNIERGETGVHIEKLEKIADILGVKAVELMSFGERNTVYCTGGENNVNSGLNIIGRVDDTDLIFSAEKLRAEISHQQEVIELQKKEIQSLQEIIDLLKKKQK